MMEATRVLSLIEEVTGDVEDLVNYSQYDQNVALTALHYMHRAAEMVRKLSNKERGVIL